MFKLQIKCVILKLLAQSKVVGSIDKPGCVDEEGQRRVDDVPADRDGALHAVAGHAPARARPRAVRIGSARAAFAEARLRRQQP